MPESKLNALINELEAELKKLDPNDANETITNVEADLKTLKALNLDDNHDEYSFLDAAIKFEDSHPKLASTLNKIAYMLNNIGI